MSCKYEREAKIDTSNSTNGIAKNVTIGNGDVNEVIKGNTENKIENLKAVRNDITMSEDNSIKFKQTAKDNKATSLQMHSLKDNNLI